MARTRSYRIELTKSERKSIRQLQKKTPSSNAKTRYAIILAADEGIYKRVPTYKEISCRAGSSVTTVIDSLKKYCTGGLIAATTPARSPNSDTARLKATGDVEAQIIAKARKSPPEGYAWKGLIPSMCVTAR